MSGQGPIVASFRDRLVAEVGEKGLPMLGRSRTSSTEARQNLPQARRPADLGGQFDVGLPLLTVAHEVEGLTSNPLG
jgi:hypothetical protein